MTHHDGKIAGYRPAVGIMLLNRLGQVLVARRIDMPAMPAWQMPQGGIDPGETPRQAALRELEGGDRHLQRRDHRREPGMDDL